MGHPQTNSLRYKFGPDSLRYKFARHLTECIVLD